MKKCFGQQTLRIWPWLAWATAVWVGWRWWQGSWTGFEFQDEGAYLLISHDPWRNSSPSFYGFVLHPLYLLAGRDPGWFRILSVVCLVAAAWGCATAWWKRESPTPAGPLVRAGVTTLLVTGSLLVYSDGQRTPSYNTLVFFGALLAWTGYFRLGAGTGFRRGAWWLMAAGLVLAFLAKWPAGVLMAALFVALVWQNRLYGAGDGGVIFRALLFAGMACLLWIGGRGIADAATFNRLVVEKSESYGMQLLPFYGLTMVNFFYRCVRAFLYGAPVLILLWIMYRRSPSWFRLLATRAWLVPWLVLGGGLVFGLTRAGASSFSRVGSNVSAEILWLAAVALMLIPSRSWVRSGFRADESVALILTPFLLGVGTNTALGDYAGHGVLFFQLAGLGVWRVLSRHGLAPALLASLLFLAATLNLLRAEASLRDQFRTAPMAECTFPWVGPGGGTVYLDKDQAGILRDARSRLQAWGFQAGDPLVAIGDMPGLVYFLGGHSPGTAWYPATHMGHLPLVLALLQTLSPETRANSYLLMNEASPLFASRSEILDLVGKGDPAVFGPYALDGATQKLNLWRAAGKNP